MAKSETRRYRLTGLSCTSCSAKFEKNVQELEGVSEAKVNYGAAKLTVTGQASIAELEQAGAFDNIKVKPEQEIDTEARHQKPAFWRENRSQLIAAVLIVLAFVSQLTMMGEPNFLTASLFIAAIIIGGYALFIEGIKDLIKFDFSMATLMTIAIIGAALIGDFAEGAIVVILFAISETLERYAADRARQSISSLVKVAPKVATIRRNDLEQTIAVQDIQINDVMLIKPGQKIAMDGIVIKGESTVNQAAITGEALPVDKQLSDEVFAGTLNEAGYLEVQVTKRAADTTLAKIIQLVEAAQGERAPAQAFVDKFAKIYTPFIILLATLIVILPPLFFGGDWQRWFYQGLSVLVVGCPCSLVISTPVSIVSAIGNAARHGVLVKGGIYLEEMGKLQAIAFDKTGTLTEGKPTVTDFVVLDDQFEATDLLQKISALEIYSQHPLASAIVALSQKRGIDATPISIENFKSLTGRGVQGDIYGITYLIGSPTLFVSDSKIDTIKQDFHRKSKTVIYFGTSDQVLAVIGLQDAVRQTSRQTIQALQTLGVKETVMLTGDNQATADQIGREVGVSAVKANLMPADKLKEIQALQATFGRVAMVGDGVNDAPALAMANVGIAMGVAGTDTALETADITLMGDDLARLPFIVRLSRSTLRTIKQNITFSLALKVIALLLVIPGWLTLWIAILADMGATILVTLNGIRLMRVK
ncbi:cadmium-translocating P-type ATPase [Lactococcus raffinolactis]|jgi:Zn2+/Cd2+-exporting ATPase|uniref:heavy metal translocating P-type ATPase n=1 Tax=Pseudolactococcus raffinolactis TaxID=1366 RepID=UPI0014367868|nr:heavy metal translocating P-type ATPase [Lactococcus raffinolactis]MBW9331228.1 cadmium-translocating P-type ATPase [Lactococcus raffinolactis]MDG4961601.1 heavy metal translocating P-type ATPase [Lactococcus raffinolactis]MDN5413149.1 cadmium-translocating P-type ATPase [Lactococcus raffinolactis]MDN5495353.1 cadmium-translocating P-type ATPase [Lactococcus raffinolactis]MDN5579221.1 cadmium-translocating P-type ATPase [Lactococcus raffinolactis]